MKILKAGTKVKTKIGEIEAMIVSVCISVDLIEYKIRYFTNGEEKISWLFPFEIEVISNNKKQAGFNNYQQEPNEDINLIELKQ